MLAAISMAAFLRGSTNPPPESWFYRAETWNKTGRNGIKIGDVAPTDVRLAEVQRVGGGGVQVVLDRQHRRVAVPYEPGGEAAAPREEIDEGGRHAVTVGPTPGESGISTR